jgi:predicted nucleic acid-binding protein
MRFWRHAPRNAHVKGDLPRYVLDSFGLLAYFGAEPGESQVKAVLTRAAARQAAAYLSVINLGEVAYITEREQGASATRRVLAAIDQLPIKIIEADRRMALAAAHVKAHYAISYADAFAVALAQQLQAVILTGDPDFDKVERLVAVEWLPRA